MGEKWLIEKEMIKKSFHAVLCDFDKQSPLYRYAKAFFLF